MYYYYLLLKKGEGIGLRKTVTSVTVTTFGGKRGR